MSYRYLGNKARISEWIVSIVANNVPEGASIADPMCGTATMSEAFARQGMRVTASDELQFAVLHAKARLLHKQEYSFHGFAGSYFAAIESLNSIAPVKGFFWREYSDAGTPLNGVKSRKYFTGENAALIDAIREKIKNWRQKGLLLHDLILAVNKVANIAGTYGYYRSSWSNSSLERLRLKPSVSHYYSAPHRVLQGKVEEIAPKLHEDVCYLDPPYTKRQYAGNYHILETIAQEDEPVPAGEGGLRDWHPQASDYCYKRHARKAFDTTLSQLTSRWVFVSYSEDGQVPEDELLELLTNYGAVERFSIPIERFRSNSGGKRSGSVSEHLYLVER
jgi:adenine-specific DNA-methyltransferase